MSRKRILFVGEDIALWEQLQSQSEGGSSKWDVAFAKTGLQALASLSQSPCDAVVADMQIPGMSGAQLLDEIMQRNPATLRFIRASLGDQQSAMKCVGTAHQYLVKPSDVETISHALDRAFSFEAWLPGEAVQKLITQMKKLPSPPNLYFKIVAELQSPDSSIEFIGHVGREQKFTDVMQHPARERLPCHFGIATFGARNLLGQLPAGHGMLPELLYREVRRPDLVKVRECVREQYQRLGGFHAQVHHRFRCADHLHLQAEHRRVHHLQEFCAQDGVLRHHGANVLNRGVW